MPKENYEINGNGVIITYLDVCTCMCVCLFVTPADKILKFIMTRRSMQIQRNSEIHGKWGVHDCLFPGMDKKVIKVTKTKVFKNHIS